MTTSDAATGFLNELNLFFLGNSVITKIKYIYIIYIYISENYTTHNETENIYDI